jgi:(1->4)-alpha-D-glucan 1-alpha-D-glucosylmutase
MAAAEAIRATYRIQLRDGVTFAEVERHVPYFTALGISHLYLSPIFAAAPGSTHGYDTVDFTRIEASLGGREGFERLSHTAQQAGLGILLDFVPNHMAAAYENPWWRAVLEWGEAGPHAAAFDIDWSVSHLLLAVLGEPFEAAVAQRKFALAWTGGRICAVYADAVRIPLGPHSYVELLRNSGHEALVVLAERFARATPQSWDGDRAALAEILRDKNVRAAFDNGLKSCALAPLLAQQIWRADDWHSASHALTYRRFFEISGLVGLCVERDEVFSAIHATLFELIEVGLIQGLRIDHIDGLRDPQSYLMKLRERVPRALPIYVEKILGVDEALRPDWPVAGTTGYEFIQDLADILVDPAGRSAVDATYRTFAGWTADYGDAARNAKRSIFTDNLASELNRLQALTVESKRLPASGATRAAIVAIAAELPVYRTYVSPTGANVEDRAIIDIASSLACRRADADGRAINAIAGMLRDPADKAEQDFVARFQQTTGALMAKAVEDTLFYRYNRLIALNEVGGAPERFGSPVDAFHSAMQARGDLHPANLLTTATHDTKRGEDARARLYALSECPMAWEAAVARWREHNRRFIVQSGDRQAPTANDEYLFYQALIGAWPLSDAEDIAPLRRRMTEFMLKAAREAKTETSWLLPNPHYEKAVEDFVTKVLNRENSLFLDDVAAFVESIAVTGVRNTLAQLVLKLTAPGIPDIYRGNESWDFSLVDPDNRRPFDWNGAANALSAATQTNLAGLVTDWRDGRLKIRILHDLLKARKQRPDLFAGTYHPVQFAGPRAASALGFLRRAGDDALLTLVTIRAGVQHNETLQPGHDFWSNTNIRLADDFTRLHWREVLTGREHCAARTLPLHMVFEQLPVAVLAGNPAS